MYLTASVNFQLKTPVGFNPRCKLLAKELQSQVDIIKEQSNLINKIQHEKKLANQADNNNQVKISQDDQKLEKTDSKPKEQHIEKEYSQLLIGTKKLFEHVITSLNKNVYQKAESSLNFMNNIQDTLSDLLRPFSDRTHLQGFSNSSKTTDGQTKFEQSQKNQGYIFCLRTDTRPDQILFEKDKKFGDYVCWKIRRDYQNMVESDYSWKCADSNCNATYSKIKRDSCIQCKTGMFYNLEKKSDTKNSEKSYFLIVIKESKDYKVVWPNGMFSKSELKKKQFPGIEHSQLLEADIENDRKERRKSREKEKGRGVSIDKKNSGSKNSSGGKGLKDQNSGEKSKKNPSKVKKTGTVQPLTENRRSPKQTKRSFLDQMCQEEDVKTIESDDFTKSKHSTTQHTPKGSQVMLKPPQQDFMPSVQLNNIEYYLQSMQASPVDLLQCQNYLNNIKQNSPMILVPHATRREDSLQTQPETSRSPGVNSSFKQLELAYDYQQKTPESDYLGNYNSNQNRHGSINITPVIEKGLNCISPFQKLSSTPTVPNNESALLKKDSVWQNLTPTQETLNKQKFDVPANQTANIFNGGNGLGTKGNGGDSGNQIVKSFGCSNQSFQQKESYSLFGPMNSSMPSNNLSSSIFNFFITKNQTIEIYHLKFMIKMGRYLVMGLMI